MFSLFFLGTFSCLLVCPTFPVPSKRLGEYNMETFNMLRSYLASRSCQESDSVPCRPKRWRVSASDGKVCIQLFIYNLLPYSAIIFAQSHLPVALTCRIIYHSPKRAQFVQLSFGGVNLKLLLHSKWRPFRAPGRHCVGPVGALGESSYRIGAS